MWSLLILLLVLCPYTESFCGSAARRRSQPVKLNEKHTFEGIAIDGEITPVGNYVLVKVKQAIEQTSGGIYMPDAAKERPTEGTVMAAGPGRVHPYSGVQLENPAKIAYSRYAKKCKKIGAFDLKAIVRANIASLEPYRCARDDYSEGILLDANENSLGSTSTKHVDLELNRYPDPLYYDIKEHVAKFRGVQKEQIFFGVGSDEAIDILFRIFCVPGIDNIVTCPPTYGMYKVCAKVNDVAVHEAPLTASFDLDVNGVLSTINAHTKMVFICSPGNPTAKRVPNSDVASVCEGFTSGLVVVDEAYIDFSNGESATALLRRYPNVVVLHTMSKAFGLAAIRLGSAIARDDIIQLMNNVKAPYNINKLSAQVALDVFKNGIPTLKKQVDALIQERHYLENKLAAVTVVKHVYASDANFILFKVPQAKKIYQILADRGIVVRYRGTEMYCGDCIRVTVGTRKENDSFLNLFVKIAAELDLE